MKILILGVNGMIGNAMLRYFIPKKEFKTIGTLRHCDSLSLFPDEYHSQILTNVNVLDEEVLVSIFEEVRPEVLINCCGLIKQRDGANEPLLVLPVNSILPHRLDRLCSLTGSRLIQISTDCIFSGKKGMYCEIDESDANDLYGKSKFIGEIHDSPSAITLRGSFIGHELGSKIELIDWFLSQSDTVKGYKKAIFSGLPTVELARIVEQYVLPKPELKGLYHVSADPIDKMSLLQLVAKEYGSNVELIPDEKVTIDRSLDSSLFRKITGYTPPSWPDLISLMHKSK